MIYFYTLWHVDLELYLDTDVRAAIKNEGATLTCRASIQFPPFTMLSLIKNRQIVATSLSGIIQINTKRIIANPFGLYVCRLNATGVIFEETSLLMEQGLHVTLHDIVVYFTSCTTPTHLPI